MEPTQARAAVLRSHSPPDGGPYVTIRYGGVRRTVRQTKTKEVKQVVIEIIEISEVKIIPGRREVQEKHVRELADSISNVGLLNPITVDRTYTLIAGLHRLEAMKLLGRMEIACTVSDLDGLQVALAEIDENFVRKDLSDEEFREMLLRRKEIYESLHPETKHGGDRSKRTKCPFDTAKSFADDTAEKWGVDPRTVRREIQTAKNLTPEAKEIIRDAKVTKKDALNLSRLTPEQQREAARQLVAGEIHSVDEYQLSPPSDEPSAEPARPELPFTLGSKKFSTIQESVADLKDTTKDCSCTPDGFLAEITAFVQKFRRDVEWYSTPYYQAVYPALSSAQLEYLRQQLDAVSSDAKELFKRMERKRKS